MPSVIYSCPYKKNTGLLLSADELFALLFYGINIKSTDGSDLSADSIETFIYAAQQEVEEFLGIKLFRQLRNESQDYYRDDYLHGFPIIKVMYPVTRPLTLLGLIGQVEQVTYPEAWLFSAKNNRGIYERKINIVPVSSAAGTIQSGGELFFTGVLTEIGLRSRMHVPNYWNIQYETGFDEYPYDLLMNIAKLAAISVLNIYGDIVLGAGIASQSLGIDGLSQSIQTTQSAENSAFSARIRMYAKEVESHFKARKLYYKSLNFAAL